MRFFCSGAIMLCALFVGPTLAASTASCPSVPGASVSVASHDGVARLSATASGVSRRALISAVACLAGFQITGMALTERTVSIEFAQLPLDRALKRLLSGENVIFLYDQPAERRPAQLRRVVLLGPSTPQQGDVIAQPAVGLADESVVVPAAEEPPRVVPEDAQAFDPDGPLEQLLPLTDHRDPRMRKAALEGLTLHDADEQARRTLMGHIGDPDPNIRLVVVSLLGPFVTQWPGAEDVVMGALRDSVSSVRRLALQIIGEASSPALADALQLALQDEDAGIRAHAEELLRDTSSGGSSASPPSLRALSPLGGS